MTEQERRSEQGQRVLMARSGARLSRTKFAEMISELWEPISREYVRRIEEGDKDPGVGFFLATAEVTGQPIDWFTEAALHNVDTGRPWFARPIEAFAGYGRLKLAS